MLRGLLKKKAVFVVLLLLGSLFVVTAVSTDTLTGTGWVEAHGTGSTWLCGVGTFVTYHFHTNGKL